MRYTEPWKLKVLQPEHTTSAERPPHCTKAHAARELNVTRSRIGQLIEARELLTIDLAGHNYVLTTSLDRYIAQQRIKTK